MIKWTSAASASGEGEKPGGCPRGSIRRGASTWEDGGRPHREDAGERKRERAGSKGVTSASNESGDASVALQASPWAPQRPRVDGAEPRAPGPRFAPRLPLRHPRADLRR